MMAIACARIISTYTGLSLTTDETFHLACGIEYLSNHSFTDLENPPIARALQALGPYLLLRARPVARSDIREAGLFIIVEAGGFKRAIVPARSGTLIFFLLACLVVGFWAGRSFGKPIAVLAVALYTLLPTTLADAGLDTTDMALGASVGAAFLAAILWAEKPTWQRALLLGACAALAVLSKFTAVGYVPLSIVLALACYWAVRRPSRQELWHMAGQRAVTLLLAGATTALLIWAAYGFSFGEMRLIQGRIFSLPAPEFFEGVQWAWAHVRAGHSSFLLGKTGDSGWWYYYPVALAVKTPIAFLIMSAIGIYVCLRRRAQPVYLFPLALCAAILLPAMCGSIDIGIRHIEPIYLGLSVIAALGLAQVLRAIHPEIVAGAMAAALLAWMTVSVAVYHPDYLAYFNGFAGAHPENVLVDSNYDWGQEMIYLAKYLREMKVKKVYLACLQGVGNHDYMRLWYGLPQVENMDARVQLPGWSVICPTIDKAYRSQMLPDAPGMIPWYDQVAPTKRLGPLALYYIPPACQETSPPGAVPSAPQPRDGPQPSSAGNR